MNELPTIQPTPQQPKPTKSIPINKWTTTGAVVGAIALICMGTFSAGAQEPETITKTETERVEVKVKDDSQQEKIVELEDELATANRKIETCQTAVLSSTQGFIDMLGAYVQLSTAASELSSSGVEEAIAMIDDIDAAGIGSQARACDETIGDQITGIPE